MAYRAKSSRPTGLNLGHRKAQKKMSKSEAGRLGGLAAHECRGSECKKAKEKRSTGRAKRA